VRRLRSVFADIDRESAKQVLSGVLLISLCLLLFGFGSVKTVSERDTGPGPLSPPGVIYVEDFDLEAEEIQGGPSIAPGRREPFGLRPNIIAGPHSAQKDPAGKARELVDLMATSLVNDLRKLGLNATRPSSGTALPSTGLLVRGVFTQVGEGNQLRRAVVGFGSGETKLEVVVIVDDLVQGSPRPFYEVDTGAESRKLPGAAITMNPYVAGAKYVLSGRDLEKNVTNTASKIAADIASHVQKREN